MNRILLIILVCTSTQLCFSQSNRAAEENKPRFKFQGDSRRTFVNRKSVGIFGIRGGFLFNGKIETGIGVYSSNLFGLLGTEVSKDYKDKSVTPEVPIPARIGFHYFSAYGEYTLINNDRLILTANSQLGAGWVDINFVDPNQPKERIRESKTLMENSVKLNIKTFEWLRLIGGLGYRFLLAGERQIKDAFNAPIYIVGFSLDFKKLLNKE